MSMVNQLPVSIQTLVVDQNGMKINYPAVVGLDNRQVQEKINLAILNVVQRLMQQQYSEQGTSSFIEMTGIFEL